MNNLVMSNIIKENVGLPDSYGIEVQIFGQATKKYEAVNHRIIDKVYEEQIVEDEDGNRKKVFNLVGPHPSPFWEFVLKDDNKLLIIPVGSVIIMFDKRWDDLVRLAKEKEERVK